MANITVERDLQRAKDLRKNLKGMKDSSAKAAIEDAAARLERRAGSKASKLGRKRRKAKNGTLSFPGV